MDSRSHYEEHLISYTLVPDALCSVEMFSNTVSCIMFGLENNLPVIYHNRTLIRIMFMLFVLFVCAILYELSCQFKIKSTRYWTHQRGEGEGPRGDTEVCGVGGCSSQH